MKGTIGTEHEIDPNIWCVLRVDLDPKEKETDERVYGAIWFDREAAKDEILRECCDNPFDEEVVLILDDTTYDGAGFRYLFSLVGANCMEWIPDIKIGALFRVVGNVVGELNESTGSIEFPNPGPSPGASLGFFSEFGIDKDGGFIKL